MAIAYTDTLVTDSAMMARWHTDSAYDYGRELVHTETSFWEWLQGLIDRLLGDVFGLVAPGHSNWIIWIVVGLAVVVGLAFYLVTRHPALFGRRDKSQPIDYQVTEDNIYGIDFDQQIERAMARADYQAAVRLTYLQTLRQLSDAGRIAWRKSKPPMQYAREVATPEMRQLVMLFIRIRYGGYECGRQQADEAFRLQQAVCPDDGEKGGNP